LPVVWTILAIWFGALVSIVGVSVSTHANETAKYRHRILAATIVAALIAAVVSSYAVRRQQTGADKQAATLQTTLDQIRAQELEISRQAAESKRALDQIATAAKVSPNTSTADIVKGVTDQLTGILPRPPSWRVLGTEPVKSESNGMYSQRSLLEIDAPGALSNVLVRVHGLGVGGFRLDYVGGGAMMMTGGKDGDVFFQRYQTPPAGRYVLYVGGTRPDMKPVYEIILNAPQ
jgi:hypothetical protein